MICRSHFVTTFWIRFNFGLAMLALMLKTFFDMFHWNCRSMGSQHIFFCSMCTDSWSLESAMKRCRFHSLCTRLVSIDVYQNVLTHLAILRLHFRIHWLTIEHWLNTDRQIGRLLTNIFLWQPRADNFLQHALVNKIIVLNFLNWRFRCFAGNVHYNLI